MPRASRFAFGLLSLAGLLSAAPALGGGTLSGTVATSRTLTASQSPWAVTANVTVAGGATLTVEPGVVLQIASGVNLTVANGGRLLAEGTADQPIRFTHAANSTARWGGLTINGAAGSPESRILHARFDANGTTAIEVAAGTVWLDYVTFGSNDHQYVSLDGASFVLSHCTFPSGSTAFELVHGTGGIKSGGHGIVRDCFFGSTIGYNDVMDFTGGNRPGQPIIEYYRNVFTGSSDDGLDLDGTDAWIEGNIFLHVHRNGAPDSSAAISGGDNSGKTSELTIVGNLFFDCDNACTAKQGNFYTLLNNTIVHITKEGGLDFDAGVVNVRDTTPSLTTFGRGYYLEANVIVDATQLVRNYDATQTTVTLVDNILPLAWAGPGGGNVVADPLLKHVPTVAETHFTSWEDAQVLWDWFSLRAGSPALRTGPNGLDRGGVIPLGASVSGAPTGITARRTAQLQVGFNRTGHGIPATDWPKGAGYTHYRWRLDGGDWSPETAITSPIQLASLPDGPHFVEVSGRRDSGLYQDDVRLGEDAVVTRSATWIVDARPTITGAAPAGAGFQLRFPAVAGESYTVESQDRLGAPGWDRVSDLHPTIDGEQTVQDDRTPAVTRLYRVVTPARP